MSKRSRRASATRLDLHLARRIVPTRELIESWAIRAGADSITQSWKDAIEGIIVDLIRDAYSEADAQLANVQTALDAERKLRQKLELELRRVGKPTPRDLRAVSERTTPDARPDVARRISAETRPSPRIAKLSKTMDDRGPSEVRSGSALPDRSK